MNWNWIFVTFWIRTEKRLRHLNIYSQTEPASSYWPWRCGTDPDPISAPCSQTLTCKRTTLMLGKHVFAVFYWTTSNRNGNGDGNSALT